MTLSVCTLYQESYVKSRSVNTYFVHLLSAPGVADAVLLVAENRTGPLGVEGKAPVDYAETRGSSLIHPFGK